MCNPSSLNPLTPQTRGPGAPAVGTRCWLILARLFYSKAHALFDFSLALLYVLAGFTVMNAARKKLLLLHPGRSQIIDNTLDGLKSSKKLELHTRKTPKLQAIDS
jgi:hypothetical protein